MICIWEEEPAGTADGLEVKTEELWPVSEAPSVLTPIGGGAEKGET